MGRCSGKPEGSPSLEPCGSDAGYLAEAKYSDPGSGRRPCGPQAFPRFLPAPSPCGPFTFRTFRIRPVRKRATPSGWKSPKKLPPLRLGPKSRDLEAVGFRRNPRIPKNPVASLPTRIRRSMAFQSASPARPGPETWPEQRLAAPLHRGTPSALPVSRLGFWRIGSGLPVPTGENVEHDCARIKLRGYLIFAA